MSILTIPQEMLEEIATHLPASSTFHLGKTCRALQFDLSGSLHSHAISPVGDEPALHWAVHNKHLPLVNYLLQFFPVDHRGADNSTALHRAVSIDDGVAVTTLLLIAGADIEAVDKHGKTPLLRLCSSKKPCINLFNLLILHGANINAQDTSRLTSLSYCVSHNRVRIALALLAAGADPDHPFPAGGMYTPLHLAAFYENRHLMTGLIAAGANINRADIARMTALHHAATSHSYMSVSLLINLGADLNTTDLDGNTPLQVAIDGSATDIAVLLLRSGAVGDVRNHRGQTPMRAACFNAFVDVVEALVEGGWGLTNQTMWSEAVLSVTSGHMYASRPRGMLPFQHMQTWLQEMLQEIYTILKREIEAKGGKFELFEL